MRSYLEELRRSWNKPLNEIRNRMNKEIEEKISEILEAKRGDENRE